MDFIKKTICIEGARTRTQGLMPYYEIGAEYPSVSGGCHGIETLGLTVASGENGNWGQIVANPCFLAEYGKTYESMLQKYYTLLNYVRNGIKLRKVETKEGEIIYTENVGSFTWNGTCFSGGEEPGFLYEYAVYDGNEFYAIGAEGTPQKSIYRYTGEEPIENEYIVLVTDYEFFLKQSKYLSGTTYDTALSELEPVNIYDGNEHFEWARYCSVVDLCIGKIDIPSWIFNKHIKAPKTIPCADIEPYIKWLTNYQTLSADCCNTRLWEDMGGDDMLEYLKTSAETKCDEYTEVFSKLDYASPYIEMPLLLIQNYTDVGVLTNVDGVEYDKEKKGPSEDSDNETRPHGEFQIGSCGFTSDIEIEYIIHSGVGVTLDQIIMCDGKTRQTYPLTESGNTYPVEVESLLQTLRGRKKYMDDKDNVLPGLFNSFEYDPSGKMFRCIRQGEENFYDLIIEQDEYELSGVTYHTLEYFWSLNTSYTKEDIDPNNFYQDFPGVPYGKYTVGEDEADWQQKYNERLLLMEEYATPPIHTPISVAKNEWRMEEIPYDITDFINGDGEESDTLHYPESEVNNIEGKHYRTITTCASGIRIAETEEEENGEYQPFMEHYYFKVKYDNSPESPMTLPYLVGNLANVYFLSGNTYIGDFIIDAGIENSEQVYFYTKYIVGGYFEADDNGAFVSYVGGGDVYYEKHPYDPVHLSYVALDGVDNVPIWSEYVDFEADAKEFYSPRLNLYRTGNTANIIEATTGEVWLSGETYDAYLTKEDYLLNFSLPPRADVNVTIERGGVSAFEKHYKLAECNTMQDLEQYNNGEFFPE